MNFNRTVFTAILGASLYGTTQISFAAEILAPVSSPRSQSLVLAKNGTALLPIVHSPNASAETKAAAQQLADYLERISGAKFTVQTGNGETGIVVGTLTQFPNAALAAALASKEQFDGVEAYAIRSEPNRLLLLANTDKGISHAVYRLLESLGCRWFFPSREWEVVPKTSNLPINIDEASRPKVLSRKIWYGFGIFPEPGKAYPTMRSVEDYNRWLRANRMNASLETNIGHAWTLIINQYRAEFEKHPEYLAEIKGVRQPLGPRIDTLKLCCSNPGVQKLVEDYAAEYFKKFPNRQMVSMDPSDGGGHCQCEKCLAMGSVSNRVFTLANVAAKAVSAKYPGRMVGLYAYNEHSVPPDFTLESNIYVELTAGFNTGKYTFPELEMLWRQKTKYLGFYTYFSVWHAGHDVFTFDGISDVKKTTDFLAGLSRRGAMSFSAESGNNWGPNGRGYYLAGKTMWDPEASVTELSADFYAKAFGPAKEPMKRFYERQDPANNPLRSLRLLAQCAQDLDEASKLAASDPAITARLQQLKGYIHYLRLHFDYEQIPVKDKEARKTATLGLLNWAYRTRWHYMEHYMAMLQAWAREGVTEFSEPDWHIASKAPKPWETGEPLTGAELEAAFKTDLQGLPLAPIEEVQFSTDLVPLKTTGSFKHPGANTPIKYQGGPDYTLFSADGKPLELDIWAGVIPAYRNRPDASYQVKDSKGTVVAQGRLPLDYLVKNLKIAVPGAGRYDFEFEDNNTGWEARIPENQPAVMQLDAARRITTLGTIRPMYFFIPKGTKAINFYFRGVAPFKMYDADGKVVQTIPASSGQYFTVPVPPGQDGRVWSATSLALGNLGFLNIPRYLSISPEALLVPRELSP